MHTRPHAFTCDAPGCACRRETLTPGLPAGFSWLRLAGRIAHACSDSCRAALLALGASPPSKFEDAYAARARAQVRAD